MFNAMYEIDLFSEEIQTKIFNDTVQEFLRTTEFNSLLNLNSESFYEDSEHHFNIPNTFAINKNSLIKCIRNIVETFQSEVDICRILQSFLIKSVYTRLEHNILSSLFTLNPVLNKEDFVSSITNRKTSNSLKLVFEDIYFELIVKNTNQGCKEYMSNPIVLINELLCNDLYIPIQVSKFCSHNYLFAKNSNDEILINLIGQNSPLYSMSFQKTNPSINDVYDIMVIDQSTLKCIMSIQDINIQLNRINSESSENDQYIYSWNTRLYFNQQKNSIRTLSIDKQDIAFIF